MDFKQRYFETHIDLWSKINYDLYKLRGKLVIVYEYNFCLRKLAIYIQEKKRFI